MRDIKKVEYYWIDLRDIAKITEEVYGIAYDIQMGEKSNGSYEIHETEKDDMPGYYTGMKKESYDNYPNYDNAKWVEMTDEESFERWKNSTTSYRRPFEKINDKGEHEWYQPSFSNVLYDLAEKGEIPHGIYFVSIDW